MKKSSWIVIGVVILLICGYSYYNLSAPVPSDEQQIRSLLASGESAIERRNIKAALSCVSSDYRDPSGFNRDALRLQIIQAFRSADGFDVALQTSDIAVSGDTAGVRTDVMLATLESGERHQVFSGPVTIRLKKEPAKRYLVFPAQAWRVTGMDGLPMSPEMQ